MPEITADQGVVEDPPSQTQPVRVMIVDDFPVVCTGLRLYLERFPDLIVDCEAYDGTTALELAVQRRPDVAIIDVRLPPSDGITLAEQLREVAPEIRVLLISGWFENHLIERGLNAGVRGFIEKTEFPQQLAAFVREVSRGGFCCSQAVRDQIEPAGDGYRLIRKAGTELASLSERERVMLECIAQGASLKQAAKLIGVTYKSADHIKQNVMRKLDVHDRVELVRRAIREGWLRDPNRELPLEPPDEETPSS